MNLLGTHDTPRILTVLGDPEGISLSREEKAGRFLSPGKKPCAVSLLKLASFLQMTFPGVPAVFYGDEAGMEGFEDPFNRRFFPWGREDRALLTHYRMLGEMRKALPVFKTGRYRCVFAEGGVFAFTRKEGNVPFWGSATRPEKRFP